ncbi:SAM-dependent methyltransferase [Paractinoplanes lichenicola]|uniref:SAM-dependent methyltransferase n=1 Tax=Paractinoplanes lichenicola TaxID=2802976 RepID=A0ABS1VPS1_9ACTN|nr:SAM-dependent methyltransferase [Actinoplanes lichenicola]MBL7255526.1 SAM-dependent methyltransferase [Actinoplanes lichenicola]
MTDTPPQLDTSTPHSARVWNYWLGGKDNYAVDREVGDSVLAVFPAIAENARACRAFLVRVVSYLAGEAGMRQFLDIGTGLPTANNTHQVAQRVAPTSKIVYVDNDPLVLVHARALLSSGPEGVTDYIDADLRDTETIRLEAGRTLDFDQPIALMLMGILGHIEDDDEAVAIVKRLVDLLPPGSYLAFYDGTDTSEKIVEGAKVSSEGGHTYHLRSPERIARFFEGLELVDPGVVSVSDWRPDVEAPHQDSYGGIGRKP